MTKGMIRRCPVCNARLEGIKTDWVLMERQIERHAVLTIGTSWNAPMDIVSAIEHQMAANLAAYNLDYDVELNLGFRGTAWIQCPEKRDEINVIAIPR